MSKLKNWFKRLLCKHELAWVRTIHGDEINVLNARTVWICEKCGEYIYDKEYVLESSAVKVYKRPDK